MKRPVFGVSDSSSSVVSVKVTGFSSLSLSEKKKHITSLSKSIISPTDAQLLSQRQYLEDKISEFELKHQMSSDKMKKLLYSGEIAETADICSWSILLKMKDDFESQHPAASQHLSSC